MPPPAAWTTRGIAVEFGGDLYTPHKTPAFDAPASLFQENIDTPYRCLITIAENKSELTPASQKIYGHALLSIVKPNSSSRLMEVSDAKNSLKHVAEKVVTRADKRKAAAAAAAMSEEARLMEMGAERAAKRAAIAARPVPIHRVVTNELRVRRF